MRDPHAYFGRSNIKPITFLNVGGNSTQGVQNFFNPLKEMIQRPGFSSWLQKHGFNPEVDIRKNDVMLPKNIQLFSGHTGTAGIEGFDRNVA